MRISLHQIAMCLVASLPGGLAARPADAGGYSRPQLLAEPGELARGLGEKSLVVLDARDAKKHAEGRVPAARWVDAPAWAKAFGKGDDVAGWSARIGALGVAKDSTVVVYDDSSSKDAARIWWILRYWGVEDARILNGGWPGYAAAGLPVEKGPPTGPTAAQFQASPVSGRLATKDQVLRSLKDSGLQILDARSTAEFCGTEKGANPRGGAIPGAHHLEWSDLLEKDTQRFKGAEELKRLFAGAGIDLSRPVAAHCQSGGRASVSAFALELLGASQVSNYYASWAEWSSATDTPVVAGSPPEKVDPDFLLQGEYLGGPIRTDKLEIHAVQVIARGKGRFDAVGYRGGLPGAGWDRGAKLRFSGRTEGAETRLQGSGEAAGLTLVLTGPTTSGSAQLHGADAQGKRLQTLPRISRTSPTLGLAPPPGAVVLFDGKSAASFQTARGEPASKTDDGLLRVLPGSGGLFSVKPHASISLHIEFRLPFEPEHEGQGRANSGCYLQGRYEVQVLDSFGLEGKENECGGVYSSGKSPDQNLCFPPGSWQTYDIDFTAAKYGADGKKTSNARLDVKHNGFQIYKDLEIDHSTTAAPRPEGALDQPLYLQDHGHELHYRNIWYVAR